MEATLDIKKNTQYFTLRILPKVLGIFLRFEEFSYKTKNFPKKPQGFGKKLQSLVGGNVLHAAFQKPGKKKTPCIKDLQERYPLRRNKKSQFVSTPGEASCGQTMRGVVRKPEKQTEVFFI